MHIDEIPTPDKIMQDKKESLAEEIHEFATQCIQQLLSQYHEQSFPSVYVNAERIDRIVIEEVEKMFITKGWDIKRYPSYDDIKQLKFSKKQVEGKD